MPTPQTALATRRGRIFACIGVLRLQFSQSRLAGMDDAGGERERHGGEHQPGGEVEQAHAQAIPEQAGDRAPAKGIAIAADDIRRASARRRNAAVPRRSPATGRWRPVSAAVRDRPTGSTTPRRARGSTQERPVSLSAARMPPPGINAARNAWMANQPMASSPPHDKASRTLGIECHQRGRHGVRAKDQRALADQHQARHQQHPPAHQPLADHHQIVRAD